MGRTQRGQYARDHHCPAAYRLFRMSIGQASCTPGTVDTPGALSAYRSYLEVAAIPAALPYVRRHARQTLADWKLTEIADDAETVLSELASNAIQATRDAKRATAAIAVYLALDLDRLYVLVWDCCPEPPVRNGQADDDAEAGRGLTIVAALTDRWGTRAVEAGKVVWAQLTVTSESNAASAEKARQ
jgi:anti-sigma regulatory factor (Ser/Thr protein kinase)